MATILVIEDNHDNVELVSRFLAREGHKVLHAGDGSKGVSLASAMRPDLILMDLSLPGMNGFDATAAIRANPAISTTPIIVVTAHAFSDDVRKAMEAGCDSYETKPVAYPRLMRKIRQLLRETI